MSEHHLSRRLPPLEAWKKPEDWIDTKTGLVLPKANRLILPTDENRLVIPHKAVETVLDIFFKSDYVWDSNLDDPEVKPDDHHFYYFRADYSSAANNGSSVPHKFRNLPTVIGHMPRQLHNTFHSLTERPEKPDLEVMTAYTVAYDAFRNLFDAARRAVESPSSYGRLIFYDRALEIFDTTEQKDLVDPDYEKFDTSEPQRVVPLLGSFAARKSINFMPMLTERAS